jgi:uncharacterized protein (DUF2141 family)
MAFVVAAVTLSVFVSLPGRAGNGAGAKTDVVEFVTHPKNERGQVVCALFDKAGWLKRPLIPAWAKIQGKRAVCVFQAVPQGIFGISAYHDENNNGELDTNALGMPIEDYGASRNARGTFGPPSFDDAKFAYRGGKVRLEAALK